MTQKHRIKFILSFMFLLCISCKNDNNYPLIQNEATSKKDYQNIHSTSNVSLFDKNLLQIVKIDNEYKLSCSENYKKIIIRRNLLHVEITEPTDYKIEKIEGLNNGFKVFLKYEMFYYDVVLVDKKIGVYYWRNISNKEKKVNEDYSFYTIDENILKTANLKKENCYENNESSKWIGEYYLEIPSIHGDNSETIDKYKIVIKDLKNIELTVGKNKFIISGKLFDENTIQGDVSIIDKNKKSAITSISPFLTLTKEEDIFYVTCPLITQGAGFSSTAYEIKKIK